MKARGLTGQPRQQQPLDRLQMPHKHQRISAATRFCSQTLRNNSSIHNLKTIIIQYKRTLLIPRLHELFTDVVESIAVIRPNGEQCFRVRIFYVSEELIEPLECL